MGAWVVGAVINLVGSVMINLGTNVMKLGHNKRAALPGPEDQKPSIKKFREWRFGVALFTIGNIGNFISFGYAAQSLLSALGCIQFVSNVIFAGAVLKEPVTFSVLLATACIVAGCVLLVAFGNHASHEYTSHDLIALYGEPAYVTYLVLSLVGVVGGYLLYMRGQALTARLGDKTPTSWTLLLPVSYALFSALIGTQSVLFSKTLSTLMRATVSGENQLTSWFTWLVIPTFLCCSVFWITRLNKGLRLFPAMVIVPTMQIAWTLFSILSGMLYFQEYKGYTPLSTIMFVVGVAVVFFGVYLLTKSQASRSHAPPAAAAAGQLEKVNMMSAYDGDAYALDSSSPFQVDADGSANGANGARASDKLPPAARYLSPSMSKEYAELEGTPMPEAKKKSMLAEMRLAMQKDFDMDQNSLRQLLGLGDGHRPAISIFGGMPGIELMSAPAARPAASGSSGLVFSDLEAAAGAAPANGRPLPAGADLARTSGGSRGAPKPVPDLARSSGGSRGSPQLAPEVARFAEGGRSNLAPRSISGGSPKGDAEAPASSSGTSRGGSVQKLATSMASSVANAADHLKKDLKKVASSAADAPGAILSTLSTERRSSNYRTARQQLLESPDEDADPLPFASHKSQH